MRLTPLDPLVLRAFRLSAYRSSTDRYSGLPGPHFRRGQMEVAYHWLRSPEMHGGMSQRAARNADLRVLPVHLLALDVHQRLQTVPGVGVCENTTNRGFPGWRENRRKAYWEVTLSKACDRQKRMPLTRLRRQTGTHRVGALSVPKSARPELCVGCRWPPARGTE